MVVKEVIIFHCSTKEFLDLFVPLISSNKWDVNNSHMQEKFVRAIDQVIKIRYEEGKDFLKCESLVEALHNYQSEKK